MKSGGGGGETGLLPKVAAVCLVVALILHLVAIAAPNWAKTNDNETDRKEHIGLWKYCTYPYGGGQSCDDFVNIITGDWLKAAQAFFILALFALPASIGLVAMCAFVPDFADDMRTVGAAIGATAVAGLFTLVCVCVWGDCYQQYFNTKEAPGLWEDIGVLDWAFGLAVTDCILTFIAAGLMIGGMAM